MAIHKKEEFEIGDQQISVLAKAMSHPARIAIIRILAEKPMQTCGEIVELLPLSQGTVSHHLKDLLDIKLIKLHIDGKKSLYELDWNSWKVLSGQFTSLLSILTKA